MFRMKQRCRYTRLKIKTRTRNSLNQVLESCYKRKHFKNRKLKHRKKIRNLKVSTKRGRIIGQSIVEVIKSICGSTKTLRVIVPLPSDKLRKETSETSVIYVGTSYQELRDMPRKESVIDLTQSDTTLFSPKWESSCSEDNYYISGDNVVDELRLRENTPTRNTSIFTIYPPKSPSLFSTPSDELCVCPQEITRKLCKKRNRSMSDVSCETHVRVKRLACSRSRLAGVDAESTDNVWKLKRTHPLNNFFCARRTKSSTSIESLVKMDMDCNLMSRNFDSSHQASLAEDMKCLKVTNNSDM